MAEFEWDWGLLVTCCRREVQRVMRGAPDAEDAVQEALTRAWRQRASCQSVGTPTAWMRAIARNEALRAISRRREQVSLDAEPELAGTVSDATDAVAERLAVRDALDALEPGDRELVELRYADDMTQLGIAKRLGLPEGTVKVRLHRIRARLVPALTESL